jgi:hypothetical protein
MPLRGRSEGLTAGKQPCHRVYYVELSPAAALPLQVDVTTVSGPGIASIGNPLSIQVYSRHGRVRYVENGGSVVSSCPDMGAENDLG